MFREEHDESVKKRQMTAAEYRQFQKDLQDTFGTLHGKRILTYLLENGKQFESVMQGNRMPWLNGIKDYVREVLVEEIMAADINIYFDVMRAWVDSRKVPTNVEVHDS